MPNILENPFKEAEDKLLFAKALDRFNSAIKSGQPTFTDFLDPLRCEKFSNQLVVNYHQLKSNINITSHGGHEEAERKMIGFNAEIFPITPITFTYNARFSKPPTHRDYLGATLGLGLDRAKIGDIVLNETGAVIYVQSAAAPFVCENLQQVKRTAVKGLIGLPKAAASETKSQEKRITVPSLRVDAVISSALNLSRAKAAALIENEKVFINWKAAKKTQTVSEGDKITVRGLGRVTIIRQEGFTKKDRAVLQVSIN
jgi:RNA-binding protein YlmH